MDSSSVPMYFLLPEYCRGTKERAHAAQGFQANIANPQYTNEVDLGARRLDERERRSLMELLPSQQVSAVEATFAIPPKIAWAALRVNSKVERASNGRLPLFASLAMPWTSAHAVQARGIGSPPGRSPDCCAAVMQSNSTEKAFRPIRSAPSQFPRCAA